MGDTVTIGLLFTASAGAALSGLTSIGSAVDKLKEKGERTNRAFTEIGAAIKKSAAAGNDVGALAKRYEGLWSSIERAKTAALGLQKAQDKVAGHRAAIGSMWGSALGTVGAGMSLALPVKEAIDFEKAMAGVKTMVPDATPQQMAELRKSLVAMTRDIPISQSGFADMAKSAGQLGIAMKDIPDFTKVVAKVSTAFEMPAEQAGTNMAKIANVYNVPIEKMTRLGDVISKLAAVGTATPMDIINATSRMGGMASMFGLNVEQAAVWTNTLVGMGEEAEVVGTAMDRMMMNLSTADKQPKDFQRALKEIHVSARGLKKAIGEDANGALQKFLATVAKAPQSKQAGIMKDLFGEEAAPHLMKLLAPKAKQLIKDSFDAVAGADGTTERVFQDKLATTSAQMELLKNNTVELGISIGTVLLPALNNVMKTVRPLVYTLIKWSEAHPKLVENIGKVAAGMVAFSAAGLVMRAGYHGIAFGAWSVIVPLKAVRATWLATSAALKAESLGAAVSKLGLVGKAATVVGGAVAGISWPVIIVGALFVASGLLIYKYWRPLKDFFIGFWRGFKAGIEPLSPIFKTTFEYWAPTFHKMGGALKPVIGWFTSLLIPVESSGEATQQFGETVGYVIGEIVRWFIQDLPNAFMRMLHEFGRLPEAMKKYGMDMMSGLIGGITGKLGEVKDTIVGAGKSVTGWFSGVLGISSPSRVFMRLGGYLDQGLSLGIGSSIGQVKAAAGALAKAAVPDLGAMARQAIPMPKMPSVGTLARQALPSMPKLPSLGSLARQALPSMPKLPNLQSMAQQALSGALPSLPKLPNLQKMQSALTNHTNITMNVSGAAAGAADEIAGKARQAVDMGFDQFRKQMDKYTREMGRRAFGGATA